MDREDVKRDWIRVEKGDGTWTDYPSAAWAMMPESTPQPGQPVLSEPERAKAWLENKLKTHKWTPGPDGRMRWERK